MAERPGFYSFISEARDLLFYKDCENKMSKGPGLYSLIGQKARDLLYDKDYDNQIRITSATENPAILSSVGLKGGSFFADVGVRLKNNNIITDLIVDTNYSVSTTVTVDEPFPGLKTILSFKDSNFTSGKLELQYLHQYAGINTNIDLHANPALSFSGVVGTNIASLGTDVSIDTKTGSLSKCDAGFRFCYADRTVSLTLNDKGDTLCGSYHHTEDTSNDSAVCAELTHKISTNKSVFTCGFQYPMGSQTMVKARVNTCGKVDALLRHELRPKSFLSLSGEFGDDTTKIGFGLTLKPGNF